MAEENKGFFQSRAFYLILGWIALGIVLSVVMFLAMPRMQALCMAWEKELPASYETDASHGEHGEGEGHHDPCHTVALAHVGFKSNAAAAFHGMYGTDGKMRLATAWALPNFLILLTILWHFAGQPLNKMFHNNRAELTRAIAAAEQARAEAEARRAEYEARLKGIDEELARLRADVRAEAEAEKARLVAEAEHQAARIRTEADWTARQELLMARYRLREEAARLAVEMAEKVIRQVIDDSDRGRLLDEYLEKIREQKQ